MKRFKILYRKTPTFMPDKDLKIADVFNPEIFAEVREIEAESLSKVFYLMQGDVWSPKGEARDLVISLGLRHTSMSCGDVAIDVEENKINQCDVIGWKPVTK